jgi:hypothetical protein
MQLDATKKASIAFHMKGYHSPSGIILGENHSLFVSRRNRLSTGQILRSHSR